MEKGKNSYVGVWGERGIKPIKTFLGTISNFTVNKNNIVMGLVAAPLEGVRPLNYLGERNHLGTFPK